MKEDKTCKLCGSKTKWYKRYLGPVFTKTGHTQYSISFDGKGKPIYHTPDYKEYVYFCDENEFIIYKMAKSINIS